MSPLGPRVRWVSTYHLGCSPRFQPLRARAMADEESFGTAGAGNVFTPMYGFLMTEPFGAPTATAFTLLYQQEGYMVGAAPPDTFLDGSVTVEIASAGDDGSPTGPTVPVQYFLLGPGQYVDFVSGVSEGIDTRQFGTGGEWPHVDELLLNLPAEMHPQLLAEAMGGFEAHEPAPGAEDGPASNIMTATSKAPAPGEGFHAPAEEPAAAALGGPPPGEASTDVAAAAAVSAPPGLAAPTSLLPGAGRGKGGTKARAPAAPRVSQAAQLLKLQEGLGQVLESQTKLFERIAPLEAAVAGRGAGSGLFTGSPPMSGPSLLRTDLRPPPPRMDPGVGIGRGAGPPPGASGMASGWHGPPAPPGIPAAVTVPRPTPAEVAALERRASMAVHGSASGTGSLAKGPPVAPGRGPVPAPPPPIHSHFSPVGDAPSAPPPKSGTSFEEKMAALVDAMTTQTAAVTGALQSMSGSRPGVSGDPLALLASGGDEGFGGLSRLPGARGAASLEITRRVLGQDPASISARVRDNRNRRLGMMASAEGGRLATRDYLIREVPFGGAKTAAYAAFGLASIFDAMEQHEWHRAEAETALLLCAFEQAALEEWRWHTAWLLTHLPEPPFHLISHRVPADSIRPLAGLADPSWTAAAVAYLKDVAILQESRKRLGDRTNNQDPKLKTKGGPPTKTKSKGGGKGGADPPAEG